MSLELVEASDSDETFAIRHCCDESVGLFVMEA